MMIVVQLSVLHFRHLLVDDLVQVVGLKLDLDLPFLFLVAISLQIVFILVDIEGILGLFNFIFLHLRLSDRLLELLSWLRNFLGDSIY